MKETSAMNRRQLLVGALALGAASRAIADNKKSAPSTSGAGLASAAAHCEQVAQACLRHCLAMLAADSSMAACAKAVADLIPSVSALAALATGTSRHTAALAKVVGEVAKDCKAECDKHPSMAPCKACGDSCATLISEIAKS
jgi:Cys-rich four helix bundle protein (predicted Tat secretion target)